MSGPVLAQEKPYSIESNLIQRYKCCQLLGLQKLVSGTILTQDIIIADIIALCTGHRMVQISIVLGRNRLVVISILSTSDNKINLVNVKKAKMTQNS